VTWNENLVDEGIEFICFLNLLTFHFYCDPCRCNRA
jgi:hypothetical protein